MRQPSTGKRFFSPKHRAFICRFRFVRFLFHRVPLHVNRITLQRHRRRRRRRCCRQRLSRTIHIAFGLFEHVFNSIVFNVRHDAITLWLIAAAITNMAIDKRPIHRSAHHFLSFLLTFCDCHRRLWSSRGESKICAPIWIVHRAQGTVHCLDRCANNHPNNKCYSLHNDFRSSHKYYYLPVACRGRWHGVKRSFPDKCKWIRCMQQTRRDFTARIAP